MEVEFTDYNAAGKVIGNKFAKEFEELASVLKSMPLFLKNSDQKEHIGRLNFDPVATNGFLKESLQTSGWRINVPIPDKYSPLGTGVDFAKKGLILEAQFSNYPFLINNIVRTELLFQSKLELLPSSSVGLMIIISKSKLYPSANSSLYYEQAKNQLQFMAENSIFEIPLRLIGLKTRQTQNVNAVWTSYSANRYSRTVASRKDMVVNIQVRQSGLSSITEVTTIRSAQRDVRSFSTDSEKQ